MVTSRSRKCDKASVSTASQPATKMYQPVSVARPTRSRQNQNAQFVANWDILPTIVSEIRRENGFEAYSNSWATKTAMEAPKAPMKVPKRKVKHTNPTKPAILMTADVQSASQEPQYAFLDEARKE